MQGFRVGPKFPFKVVFNRKRAARKENQTCQIVLNGSVHIDVGIEYS